MSKIMLHEMRPKVEGFVGNYVRAIHDFHTDLAGEVSLRKGDVFKVTEVVDKNWLRGINKEKEGNFPTDFVEKLCLPLTERGQKVFAATENFPAQQDGDLEFTKGDVILGLAPIDDFWWNGQCRGRKGIFPLTHVTELEVSKLLKSRSKSVHSSEPLFARAQVDSVGQLDEELSFQAGDIITVTEVIDEDWYQGECRGKSGMFLATCVQLINEDECSASPPAEGNHSGAQNIAISDTVQIKSDYSSHNSQSNVHVESNKIVPDHYATSGTNQTCHDKPVDTGVSYTSENTKAHNDSDTGVTPYARTLYPFVGELADELSFDANDIVTLIQHVDEQWIEGEIDGKIGLLPANYVEIVVDCPYAYKSEDICVNDESNIASAPIDVNHNGNKTGVSSGENVNAESYKPKEINEETSSTEEHYGLVLYDFVAETAQDITVNEGETVTVIKQIDDNWLLVRNEEGTTGMCPGAFIDIIGAPPELPSSSHDDNYNVIKTASGEAAKEEHSPDKMKNGNRDFRKHSFEVHDKSSVINSSKEEENEASLMKKPLKADTSIAQSISSKKSNMSIKPVLKPKPVLAPKPALKPKPSLSPKPWATSSSHKPVAFEPTFSIPKSTSSQSLSKCVENSEADSQTSSMTKAQSMFEINNQSDSKLIQDTSLIESEGSNQGSLGSLTTATTERRNSTESDSQSKKTFEDWDLSKPLDTLLHNEFTKAKYEADIKSRSSSLRSSGSSGHSHKSIHETDVKAVDEPDRAFSFHSSVKGNYSRDNFEGGLSVGNSTFFLSEDTNEQKRGRHLRKPPPPPGRSSVIKESNFARKPSLKKPAPPRPVGPRIAPAPSKVPIVPTRTVPAKTLPSRPVPAQMGAVPARPQGAPRKHGRPAPPRPGATPAKPPGEDLMGFSPTNSSLYVGEVEEDTEAVQELRTRIKHLETDIQDFEKSKAELLQMQVNIGDNEDKEIHDNIEFYEDNIKGLKEELKTLKEQLAIESPGERDKMDEEKRIAERKIQEERMKEEMKRKREEQKEERKEKRIKVINELIQTEKDFLTSLNLIMETFLGPKAEKHKEVDVVLMFGNIEEVAEVAQKLLTKLEDATNGKDFPQQVIGTCFVSLAEDMKNVYAPYCRNHDDVITLIEKYNQNADIKAYLDRLLDKLRENHVVFDLEALLIKPVQRILKYPLLLNELFKTTEDDHPDKKEVMVAIKSMTDVAAAINEYKRRKDLVYKYKKDTDASLGDKLSKLSLHSIKKKSSRIKERFSANLGFIEQTRDPNFDKEETRYRHLEKTVRVFIRDVQSYLEEVESVVTCQESITTDIEDFYAEKRDLPEVEKYQSFYEHIHMTFLPNFKVEVDELVVLPLGQMTQMFEGPNKVIQKRYDKLLDYDNLKRKCQSDKVFEKPMQLAKQNYEALNAQLLDELPRMYTLACQLFRDCVGSFVRAQREFHDKMLQQMYALLDLGMLNDDNIIEEFNIRHTTVVDKLAMLSFMPKTFSPRVADQKQDKKNKRMSLDPTMLRSTDAVPQIDSQRIYVTQQYAANKLFRVTETHVAIDSLDISLCEGDVVGVIVEKDPMGNKDRWFVDNGASKGFVSKKLLVPHQSSPSRPQSVGGNLLLQPSPSDGSRSPVSPGASHSWQAGHSPGIQSTGNGSVLHSLQEADDIDFALEEEMVPDIGDVNEGYVDDNVTANSPPVVAWNTASQPINEEPELFYAEYAFSSRNENEVSLFEHQVVTVIAMQDQEGNPEWWYVEADGHYGYAPSSYLRKMDAHGDPT
ncbi:dynamin-binding protein-like isoform X2 [Mercenaria mercenaria]|uniref:dynamin-binding protein-like isoform X2 n=1 Tax=Mercenaria mercenaria TaxID=6596 RepID=UPI00234F6EEF|nr:dynamin-binding protein-like isoform X2 [Mercenaria mercenaria]